MIKEAVEKMFPGTKGCQREHHELRRQEQETRNDLRQDRCHQEGYRKADRGQQGDRDLPGSVRFRRDFEPSQADARKRKYKYWPDPGELIRVSETRP